MGWFVDSRSWTLFVFEYGAVASPIKCRETGWLMDLHDAMAVAIRSCLCMAQGNAALWRRVDSYDAMDTAMDP